MKVDWAYIRKGWVSCKKAGSVFAEKNIEVEEQVNAARDTISGEDVWELVSGGSRIVVAQNKKILEFDPQKDDKADIIACVSGRTGNLRAPTLRIGSTYYVGINEELYASIAVTVPRETQKVP